MQSHSDLSVFVEALEKSGCSDGHKTEQSNFNSRKDAEAFIEDQKLKPGF